MEKGDRVKVFNYDLKGKKFLEGEAVLISIYLDDVDYPEERIWSVHFDGDTKGDNYNRFQRNMVLLK